MARTLRAWGPAALWAAVLFLLSAQPNLATRGWLSSVPDEVLHLGSYTVLGASLAHARFWGATRVPHVMMMAIGAFFGATDELHQAFVPRRVPSMSDWLADVAGVTLGYTLAWLIASVLASRIDAHSKEAAS